MHDTPDVKSPAHQGPRPRLVVVTGRPGAGKSTLAHKLARAVHCPLISRDELKEGYVNSGHPAGAPAGDAQKHIYSVFFHTLGDLLEQGVSLVAEAAFQHKAWAPGLEPLRLLADLRLVVCEVDAQHARDRRVERGLADPGRERFHADPDVALARAGGTPGPGTYDPPRLEVPTLQVDTADGYAPAFERIVDFAMPAPTPESPG
ncbi:MAG: AAA family ATPase [Planctomycetota bacterium]